MFQEPDEDSEYWEREFKSELELAVLKKGNQMNDQISMDMAESQVPVEFTKVDEQGNPVPVTIQTSEDVGAEDQPLN